MNEMDVVNAAEAAGGVGGVLVAIALIMKNLPAVLDSVREWHLGVKRLNFLRYQFDQTRKVENVYLYPPASSEPAAAEPQSIEPGEAA